MPRILMASSAAIILALGALHLLYTFRGTLLQPRDPVLQAAMGRVHPRITRETTMWRAWVGFNASHGMGAVLFGLVYAFLAIAHAELLFDSAYLLSVGLAVLLGLLALARAYWFRAPAIGIAASLACYVASIVASRA